MNHQRFKFYHHSTEYYRQLYNSIKQLEDNCKEVKERHHNKQIIIDILLVLI